MIGIILLLCPIFFIWRYYSELAFEHERPRAGFGILGIGVYIVSYIVLGILAAIVMVLLGAVDSVASGLLLEVVSVVLGGVVAWLVYVLLKRSWEKSRNQRDGLLDN